MRVAFIPATFRSTQPRAAERNKGSLPPTPASPEPLKCLLVKEFLQESSLTWEGLDQRHQVRSSTKVMVGKTSFPRTFMSVHISAEVRHALDEGISCPVLYPDPPSAESDEEDEQTAKTSLFLHPLQLLHLRSSPVFFEVPKNLTQSQDEPMTCTPSWLSDCMMQQNKQGSSKDKLKFKFCKSRAAAFEVSK